jgi:acyl-coenzyme A synthetase/AMP-(fatty) acid ligase
VQAETQRRISFLREKKFGKGDLFLITHGGTPMFFADLFAVWGIGGIAACLNPKLVLNELETVSAFTQPKAILLGSGQGMKELSYRGPQLDLNREAKRDASCDVAEVSPHDPALILFTSGTTGDPKGVVHTYSSLQARLENNWRHLAKDILARTLCVLPTHFGHGLIGNCLTPLLSGQHLFLFQDQGIKGAARLGGVIDENGITFLSSVPSFWKVVLKASSPPREGSLGQVSVGSAPLSSDHWRAIMDWAGIKNVVNMYGITETANWAAGASGADYEIETGLVGKMWGGEARVMTSDSKRQAAGEGELLLKPPSLMKGYFQRPDLTDQAVRGGWYHTGDIGSIDKAGIIRLLGRSKTEINRAGMKILPEEIDVLLEGHEEVLEACAFGVPDPISGEMVAIAYTLKKGSQLSPADLRAWCGERIRLDCVPEKWYPVSEIPKTDRGKVNRRVVMKYCLEGKKQ